MSNRLQGKRALITQCDDYMGPKSVEMFREEGAEVITSSETIASSARARELVTDAGDIDILVANFAADASSGTSVDNIDDDVWAEKFSIMVDPLHWMVQAVTPQMLERKKGKIVVFGSATPLRGMRNVAAYSAARGAQVGYVRAVGAELAASNINVNLIAQNFIENEDYYPKAVTETDRFQAYLKQNIPARRLGRAEEDVALAIFLAGDESDFFCGQIIPFAGGWAT